MGYGILEVYGISLVTKLVDAPNPWVITGYGVSEVWFRTELTVVTNKILDIQNCHDPEQTVDILTKALPRPKFM